MKADNDNTLHFLSVCAGIEAASLAWHNLGWRACLLSEIEKFPRRVLAHHYPDTRLWGDFTALRVRHLRKLGLPLPSVLVGGTPCQAFSVAGLRLTPRECERLQGFPDDFTLLPGYDADGPRYKALGNSMAVPVMRWIGERIALHMPAANDNAPGKEAA